MKQMKPTIQLASAAIFAISTSAIATPSVYRLFDLSCKNGERATGCSSPFIQCEAGNPASVVETCLLSARFQKCDDFTWEKCCATNCFIRNENKMIGTEKCMDTCSKFAAAGYYAPGKKSSRKSK